LQPKDSAFYGDLKNMIPTTVDGVVRMMPDPASRAYTTYQDAKSDVESVKATGRTIQQRKDDARKAAGYGPGYRIIAPVGEQLGVNATGMEQAAKEGDSAAVLGHAAAAATPYVAGAIGGEVMRAPAVKSAVSATADAVKAAPKAVVNSAPYNFFADISNAKQAGGAVGGIVGGVKGLTVGAPMEGAIAGTYAGSKAGAMGARVLSKLRDVLNRLPAPESAPNPTTTAESNFAEAGSREPEVVHANDEDLGLATAYAAPAKVKAILDKAEADIKQITAPKEQQPAAPGSREDKLDDRAMSQEMGWDVARHYFKGIAEQRDMAASTLSSKTELTTQAKVDTILAKAADDARTVLESAKIPAEGTKARIAGRIPASWVKDGKISLPKPGDDLVDLLQRSIDAAKTKKGPGSGGEGNGGAK
jgi:hypothetical protein